MTKWHVFRNYECFSFCTNMYTNIAIYINKKISQWFLKYENLDLFQIFVNETIWIYLQSVEYYLITNWLHLSKYPYQNYKKYLLVRYFNLCSGLFNCTNVNKTSNIDSKVPTLYSKNASYHFPSNIMNFVRHKVQCPKIFTFVQ